MDTPGFGASDDPPEIPGGMEYYSRALLGLLDALEIESAHLVGLRTGASISLETAAAHPERVRSAVLSGTLFLQTEEDKRYWREEFSVPKKWEADGQGAFLDDHVLEWVRYFASRGRRRAVPSRADRRVTGRPALLVGLPLRRCARGL